ncbi:MAG: ATPase with chaperone activity [Caldimonas sp.]
MTYDHNQLEIPASFVALFIPPGRVKPTESREFIGGRYEVCEDLAGQLVEHARALHVDRGLAQDEVLSTLRLGLQADASGMSGPEAEWTVRRLAELEGWGYCPPA